MFPDTRYESIENVIRQYHSITGNLINFFQHLSPLPKQLLMVQQTMSGSTRASATNQEALQFLETIFSTPDLGVLALEV